MNSRLRLIPRIALFSALIYVLSWGTSYLPNVNLVFFIAFMAGAFWGLIPGVLVGAIGMGLWTTFHPFYLPVNLVDAWIFRPFWPRFIGGMAWSLISLGSNAIIFPVLFRPVWYMYNRERLI